MIRHIFLCLLLLAPLLAPASPTGKPNAATGNSRDRLWQSFLTPPDSIKVGCYYIGSTRLLTPRV